MCTTIALPCYRYRNLYAICIHHQRHRLLQTAITFAAGDQSIAGICIIFTIFPSGVSSTK